MIKPVLASISALAASVLLAVGASAGAMVLHFNLNSPEQCFSKGTLSYCASSTGEETDVQAASGNFSGNVNGTSSYVFSDNGTVVGSGTSAIHEHVLYASNFTVLKEGGIHMSSTSTFAGTTCTFSFDLHVTGLNPTTGTGRIQYDNFSSVCV